MFDKVEEYRKGTQEHAIAMLHTYGMYSNVDENKLVIVPRNYVHSVLIVHNEAEMTNPEGNYYIPTKGRMVLRKFKTSLNFQFDSILPTSAKESVNAYITTTANPFLI